MRERKEIISKLKKIFKNRVLIDYTDKLPYITDASEIIVSEPLAVVFPISTEEVVKLINLARQYKTPLYARGGGSSLSGGAVPLSEDGIVVSFTKMNKILEIRERDLQVLVEPGIVLEELNNHLAQYNLFFPVDPASSSVATIGGMIAENAGGVRAVKYGVTRNWILSLEVVTGTGKIIKTGASTFKQVVGYDLTSLFVGSEGTLGLITKALLRVTSLPKYKSVMYGFFNSQEEASEAIHEVITAGIDVTAIEFMDKNTLEAIKAYTGFEYKGDAIVIIEVTGNNLDYINFLIDQIITIFREHGVIEFKRATSSDEYNEIWKVRKSAAPALANVRPKMFVLDPTVPISAIPEYIKRIREVCKKHGVQCAAFGHAGDGNVHPHVMYDPNNEEEYKRALKAAEEIYKVAIEMGGTVSGEHGVGIEKLKFLGLEIDEEKIRIYKAIKEFFDPDNILNPGKILATGDRVEFE